MSSDGDISWRGVSIEDIFDGYNVFEDRSEAPKVVESENHTLLFKYPLKSNGELEILSGDDKWDDFHVKLPCSPESVYYEIDDSGEKIKKFRWDLIKSSLSSKISNSQELESCIKAYNTKFESIWKFKSLHALFEDEFLEEETEYFFETVLPKIIEIALRLPELIKTAIPLLKQTMNHSLSMTKEQAACLLANAFLCTFPKRNGPRKNTDFPEINFNRLFCNFGSSVVQKIKCLCNYFRRVLVMYMPQEVITFQRRHIELDEFPKWEESDLKFSAVKWHIDSYGRIEKGHGMLQMDFANRYLGGGALGHGCVQEEIRFMINPELIIGMLFCESMKSTESILIYGSEQYSKYSGYAGSFKWEGNFIDEAPCDKYRRKLIQITAVDALPFRNPYMQFDEKLIRRDLNKAFCGFYHDPSLECPGAPVSGGFWGCGAFGGYHKLKSLILLIACVANRRNLVFYTFGDEELVEEMHSMFTFLSENDISVAQLWNYFIIFKSLNKKFEDFYQFIYDQHAANIYLEGLEFQSDTLRISDDYGHERSMGSTDYEELENPSKRTKTDDSYSSFNDDKSQIGSEVEIEDRSEENLDVENLQEIVIVTNTAEQETTEPDESTENDIKTQSSEYLSDMVDEKPDSSIPADEVKEEDSTDQANAQKKTILDYFKPKSPNS